MGTLGLICGFPKGQLFFGKVGGSFMIPGNRNSWESLIADDGWIVHKIKNHKTHRYCIL